MKKTRLVFLTGTFALLWFANPEVLKADKAKDSFNRGTKLLRERNLEAAKAEFEEALRRKHDYPQARILLGLTHYDLGQQLKEQGELGRAIAETREAVRLEPDEAYWHFGLAHLLRKSGNVQEAAAECAQAAQLSPKDSALAAGCDFSATSEQGKANETDQMNAVARGTGAIRVPNNGVSPPFPTYKPEPPYSKKARLVGLQGSTVLFIVVDTRGLVVGATVIKPLGLGLDQNALETVRTWRFKPGMQDGKPVAVKVMVEIVFRL